MLERVKAVRGLAKLSTKAGPDVFGLAHPRVLGLLMQVRAATATSRSGTCCLYHNLRTSVHAWCQRTSALAGCARSLTPPIENHLRALACNFFLLMSANCSLHALTIPTPAADAGCGSAQEAAPAAGDD